MLWPTPEFLGYIMIHSVVMPTWGIDIPSSVWMSLAWAPSWDGYYTQFLTWHSDWKVPFIVSLVYPWNMVIFHSYVNVYQRIYIQRWIYMRIILVLLLHDYIRTRYWYRRDDPYQQQLKQWWKNSQRGSWPEIMGHFLQPLFGSVLWSHCLIHDDTCIYIYIW